MKQSKILFIVFTVLVGAIGCQKQPEVNLDETVTVSNNEKRDEASCRTTSYFYADPLSGYSQLDTYTYANNLLDEYHTFYGWVYKMKYDVNKKMKGTDIFIDGELAGKIDFIRRNNKIVKELWYEANADEPFDQVVNTYDARGNLIKSESIYYNYTLYNEFNANGFLISWLYTSEGVPLQKAEYQQSQDYKNPFQSINGLEYNFAYANSAFGTGFGNKWYSSEKVTFFDENGEDAVYYYLDPSLTTGQTGSQNLPLTISYYDQSTNALFPMEFTYENCGGNLNITPIRKMYTIKSRSKNIRKRPLIVSQRN